MVGVRQIIVILKFFCFLLVAQEGLTETRTSSTPTTDVNNTQATSEPVTRPSRRDRKRMPAQIYVRVCAACHQEGNIDAPRVGSDKEWAPRIAKGIETLYQHALYGFNSMPPRGLCKDCTDDELKAIVDFMVRSSS
jgi:cytochrome c5